MCMYAVWTGDLNPSLVQGSRFKEQLRLAGYFIWGGSTSFMFIARNASIRPLAAALSDGRHGYPLCLLGWAPFLTGIMLISGLPSGRAPGQDPYGHVPSF